LVILAIAAVTGTAGGLGWSLLAPAESRAEDASATMIGPTIACSVTDGDTIRCAGERVRLLAIDAPELPGHCRPGRDCVPGDPYTSMRSLERAMRGGVRIQRVGTDRYGRTLALVTGPSGDLSCHQLRSGMAVYREDWDNQHRVAEICPDAAR
jgi:endonuclease YncB( thermonuclease family)